MAYCLMFCVSITQPLVFLPHLLFCMEGFDGTLHMVSWYPSLGLVVVAVSVHGPVGENKANLAIVTPLTLLHQEENLTVTFMNTIMLSSNAKYVYLQNQLDIVLLLEF